ncbi:carboxymuconolactone decarboxylase family protein [Amycolatopsis granulosa]|uniref:carboxymuconolactone decarboxylase family protein n=1 Tax=Amycolatopsis granulosa TaxID=185684 RepID=UPI001420B429|nr:carboxymuconolactone decarboxylase family protein [Amycolatopsis granulosa]NIH83894.1 4-carboxymuconolactone decarboxylase [Amycolatopsis granulosa]
MTERFRRGLARQQEIGGAGPRRQAYDALADVAPDLSRLAVEFELVILGALITTGGVEPQLEAHVGTALAAGLAPRAVVEAIMQVIPYAGFPRVFAAMAIARRVFDDRNLLPLQ